MPSISLAQANTIISAAFEHGRDLELNPLSVAVLDSGGHMVSLQRQDGCSLLRPQIATGKAAGALALGVSSRTIADMAEQRARFVAALGPISPHGIIPAPGGVIITDAGGDIVGAVGITGDTSDNDETCAIAGIRAAGLMARL